MLFLKESVHVYCFNAKLNSLCINICSLGKSKTFLGQVSYGKLLVPGQVSTSAVPTPLLMPSFHVVCMSEEGIIHINISRLDRLVELTKLLVYITALYERALFVHPKHIFKY